MTNEKLTELLATASAAIVECDDLATLQNLKIKYLGKKSFLASLLATMPSLESDAKAVLGRDTNVFKNQITKLIAAKVQFFNEQQTLQTLKTEAIDITLPAAPRNQIANKHPLTLVMTEISNIFQQLGYQIVSGTEVDSDEYNFERLNLAKDHPARDMQDSFYLAANFLLRTHCTNVLAHYLADYQADTLKSLAVISMGNVYRRDEDDATHSHQFLQVDGFCIAPNISFANLKWTLNYLMKRLFGDNVVIRLRPSYFPFTEPSVEVDVTCTKCHGSGCNICKQTGWLEILGAGIINSQVFIENNLPPTLQGFAFGIGIERIAMLKYGIDDIRSFYTNDYRFLKQFNNF